MSVTTRIGALAGKIAARFDDRDRVFYAADMVAFTLRGGVWHVLVIRRGWNPGKGKLALPGGHVERGETSRAAAVRELAEETGIRVRGGASVDQLGVFDDPGRDARGRYVSVAYGVCLGDAPDPVAADDAATAEWMPLHEALRVADEGGFAFDHRLLLATGVCHYPMVRPAR
ncbi:NUDIX domain-containing protein [Amycolatopsis panacis]|uniref:NUDIX hydrolase n=1 Tax=Amycolatopsis panacis TaxID=2340917 RepID=A0A419I3M2_9PSEU|nr:NUDIX hydrolase [Amycolatopsis panacis]RJQ84768.1 NUDIX hydrolase [Amycolatopsis panacis]